MKRKLSLSLLYFIIIITVIFSFAGCGASQMKEDTAASEANYAQDGGARPEAAEESKGAEPNSNDSDNLGQLPDTNILGDRKIIYNSYVNLEVEDFEETYNILKGLVEGTNSGYIQNTSVRSHKVSNDPETYRKEGTIVLRVAQKKFSSILSEIEKLGRVINTQTNTEEVTDQYYDTESRLKIYEEERDRVIHYLSEAEDLETMLILERKLSEITYEIDKLKGTLRHLDNLVDFSTITVDVEEKSPTKVPFSSLGSRIIDEFKDSIVGIVDALGDMVIGLIRLIPTFVILLILYLILKPIGKKIIQKRNNKISS